MLGRIDIHIEVPAVPQEELLAQGVGETSATVRERVTAARARQLARQRKPNVELGTKEVERHCRAPTAPARRCSSRRSRGWGFQRGPTTAC
jgi:magnesium chelatase family protein